jgi:hypothetical protein
LGTIDLRAEEEESFMFGRKKPTPPPSPEPSARPGHDAVLAHLRRRESDEPLMRPQLAGRILYDLVCRMVEQNGRIRADDILAILASCGGFACILAALDICAAKGQTPQQAGMVVAETKDGTRFFFGDLPNRMLIESEHALLSLALGAAQAQGGAVTLDLVHDAMGRVASSIGNSGFGVPQLPDGHHPSDLPINLVRHLWPRFSEALALYEVPSQQAPAAFGFALQRAISEIGGVIDPLMAARIAIECAVPMAKLDPAQFA